jgi:hypothetical protein
LVKHATQTSRAVSHFGADPGHGVAPQIGMHLRVSSSHV